MLGINKTKSAKGNPFGKASEPSVTILNIDTNQKAKIKLSADFRIDLVEVLKQLDHSAQDLANVSIFMICEGKETELRPMPTDSAFNNQISLTREIFDDG